LTISVDKQSGLLYSTLALILSRRQRSAIAVEAWDPGPEGDSMSKSLANDVPRASDTRLKTIVKHSARVVLESCRLQEVSMSHRSFVVLALLFSSFTFPLTAPAQVLYGSLTGNVTDSSGAAVPNAKVDATNVSTGIGKQATTDVRGVFLIQD